MENPEIKKKIAVSEATSKSYAKLNNVFTLSLMRCLYLVPT